MCLALVMDNVKSYQHLYFEQHQRYDNCDGQCKKTTSISILNSINVITTVMDSAKSYQYFYFEQHQCYNNCDGQYKKLPVSLF